MPLVVKDRVRETSTTTGTGTITLNGAVSNFQSFTAIGDGNTTFYTITLDSAGEWEVGIGTYTASGTTLSRDIVLESSNSGSLVPFSAGTKNVFVTYPAETSVSSGKTNVIEVNSTDAALRITQLGTGNALVVEDDTNPDSSPFVVDASGLVGIGTTTPIRKLTVAQSTSPEFVLQETSGATDAKNWRIFNASNTLFFGTLNDAGTSGVDVVSMNPSGNVGIKTVNDNTAIVQIGAGTATVAPLEFINGTLMTTPDGGSMEFDGNNLSFTNDATSLRGYVPATNLFRLTANGAAIGAGIANFFGANSAISVAANADYALEAYCYFTKTTAGTVTVTLTSSQAPLNINGTVDYGAAAGGNATGAANRISLFASASTAAAFGASASLTTAVNHAFIIRAIIETHATNAGNIRINFTSSAGTVTPLRGSYYKLTKLPPGNSGNFVA
jgi:hypothetical protein